MNNIQKNPRGKRGDNKAVGLDFAKMNGLIPVIVQDIITMSVVMLGFMNEEAYEKTLESGKVTFYSRTRKKLWQKGEGSGNFLEIVSIKVDCDKDTLLIKVIPKGPTCHLGKYSCFGEKNDKGFARKLFELIRSRKKNIPKGSYTTFLFKEGLNTILAKVEEESLEVIKAAKNETKQRLVEESCDLIYHMMVLLVQKDVKLDEIEKELNKRRK